MGAEFFHATPSGCADYHRTRAAPGSLGVLAHHQTGRAQLPAAPWLLWNPHRCDAQRALPARRLTQEAVHGASVGNLEAGRVATADAQSSVVRLCFGLV